MNDQDKARAEELAYKYTMALGSAVERDIFLKKSSDATLEQCAAYHGFRSGYAQGLQDGRGGNKGKCPCGGIILADTEDWKTPLCYTCYTDLHEGYLKLKAENEKLRGERDELRAELDEK